MSDVVFAPGDGVKFRTMSAELFLTCLVSSFFIDTSNVICIYDDGGIVSSNGARMLLI